MGLLTLTRRAGAFKAKLRLSPKFRRCTIPHVMKFSLNAATTPTPSTLLETKVSTVGGAAVTGFMVQRIINSEAFYIYFVESIFSRCVIPELCIETSRPRTLLNQPTGFLYGIPGRPTCENVFQGLIFSKMMEQNLVNLIDQLRLSNEDEKNYANVYLSGPSGTGKTNFSKNLCLYLNTDYVMMDMAYCLRLESEGLVALRRLFNWLLLGEGKTFLIIKNIDCFLDSSTLKDPGSAKSLMNSFINRASSCPSRIKFIFISNRGEGVHKELKTFIDMSVEFHLPGDSERCQRIIRDFKQSNPIIFDENLTMQLSKKTEGLSLASISTLSPQWKLLCRKLDNGEINYSTFVTECSEVILNHKRLLNWRRAEVSKDSGLLLGNENSMMSWDRWEEVERMMVGTPGKLPK